MKQPTAFLRFEAFRTSWLWFAVADTIAMLLAAALPWSTSLFLMLLASLLAIICGSVDVPLFIRSLKRPASVASVVFFVVALLGIVWSTESLPVALKALSPVSKFLILPFLLYYFEKSDRGTWVLGAFLFSCAILMINSWVVTFEPTLAFKTGRCCGEDYGVPVRNYIDQSQEFTICMLVLLAAALTCFEQKKWRMAALSGGAATAFAANLVFVVVSRTALVCIPIMSVVLAWRHWRARGVVLIVIAGTLAFGASWLGSSHLRNRVWSASSQFQEYRDHNAPSSVGKRIEFWRKSLVFFEQAPVIGHGTGSTLGLFERDAVGKSAVSAEIIANPHNQILNVAIQWGALGLVGLTAFWVAHVHLFWKRGFIADIGLLIVVQNIAGSLFNSHLFDFTEGWLYVLGIGVVGGIVAKTPFIKHEGDVA